MKQEKYFSTGDVARKFSVTPNTVLKWIKSGRLQASQTAGGHYRVAERDFRNLAESNYVQNNNQPPVSGKTYCWEFMAHPEKIKADCKKCIVFRSKSEKCYELSGLKSGHRKTFCRDTCQNCKYFKALNDSSANLMVITDNSTVRETLASCVDHEKVNLYFSENEVDGLLMIENLSSPQVLIDYSLIKRKILNSLVNNVPALAGTCAAFNTLLEAVVTG